LVVPARTHVVALRVPVPPVAVKVTATPATPPVTVAVQALAVPTVSGFGVQPTAVVLAILMSVSVAAPLLVGGGVFSP